MKRIVKRVSAVGFVGAVIVVGGVGVHAAQAAFFPPWACPHIYAPVICDDGNIYSNQCYADSYGATGCVPYNWFPF